MNTIDVEELRENIQDAVCESVHSSDCDCKIEITVYVSDGWTGKPEIVIT